VTKRKHLRPAGEIVADIQDAGAAAADLVAKGKEAWDADRLLRFAGEAVIGRIAEAAGRLPKEVTDAIADVPWEDIRDIRILVVHIYHRIDYDQLWKTLEDDVPFLMERVEGWRSSRAEE